ncbi:MAG: protocatechuate 3,4-dioxygenase [Proteobacteria bacterium]|nr:protocatechuate 3,4-dioxygenase [Pseudomonadota bacterium]
MTTEERSQPPQAIPGTFVFTGERSRRGYRLNKLASTLTDPANRERFRADENAYMEAMGLNAKEQDIVRRRDWKEMVEHGGNIYVILKIAATVGQTLLDMGAQMRGETLPQFLATRPGRQGHKAGR